jgi:predicted kinase
LQGSSRAEIRGIRLLSPLLTLPATAHASPLPVHLILLIGLPGSGKSSIATKLVEANPQRCLISTDAIRAQLFGDEAVQGAWSQIWRELEQQMQNAVNVRVETIFDATNVVRKQRREAIALARQCGFTYITALWLNTPLTTCLERNQNRDRRVPVSVILDMYRCLVGAPPALEEGVDRLIEVRGRTD